MAIISGPCKWAHVQQPDTTFEPRWCIDIVLTEDQKKNLEAAGLKTKKNKDGELILTLKRKVTSKEGKAFDAPEVVDAEGLPFTKLIGNGSTVKVKFSTYDWEAFGNAGKSGWLEKVIVLEHVAYEEEDETDFDTGKTVDKDDGESFDDEQF